MSSKVKTTAKSTSTKKAKIPEEEIYCIIRIRGAHGMNRKILHTLHLLNLYRVNSAVLVKTTPSVRGMIQKVKDYVAYGPVSADNIKRLLEKRALLEGNKPLTDHFVRTETVYKSIPDLANAIHKGKIAIKEIKGLKPVFRLHPPIGGYPGSIKKPIGAGGSLGKVGDKINIYLRKMI
ncbi:MAG: 50S ribosomal protein L30 [Candidatus Lokiarchaeota archaeon]|nr:50S ribosomal protein L30 [Candidatus Harpocratesius repetitus]